MKDAIQPAGATGGSRWMIVDDNPEMLALLREAASLFTDASIDCCGTPQAALAAFEIEPGGYGFVITDFEMPGMNGAELCRRVRNAAPGLKVLLATGSLKITHDEARQHGFCGVLDKPFRMGALGNAL